MDCQTEMKNLIYEAKKKIYCKAIDDVLEILKRYEVPFNADANNEILQLKEVEGNG